MFVLTIRAQNIMDPEFDKFPIFSRPLTIQEEGKLGLEKRVLVEPLICLNWSNKKGKFILDTLSIGTVVLIDKNGIIRYKVNCGNRLMVMPTTISQDEKENGDNNKKSNWVSPDERNKIRENNLSKLKTKNNNNEKKVVVIVVRQGYYDPPYYTHYYPNNYIGYDRVVRTRFGAVNYPR